jgi:hypothetical protein
MNNLVKFLLNLEDNQKNTLFNYLDKIERNEFYIYDYEDFKEQIQFTIAKFENNQSDVYIKVYIFINNDNELEIIQEYNQDDIIFFNYLHNVKNVTSCFDLTLYVDFNLNNYNNELLKQRDYYYLDFLQKLLKLYNDNNSIRILEEARWRDGDGILYDLQTKKNIIEDVMLINN